MTDRELFLAMLFAAPLRTSNALVVLAGEDGKARLEAGLQLMRHGVAPRLLITGGRHEPPAILGAGALEDEALSAGCAPDRLMVETRARNTREQAEETIRLALAEEWDAITLVASAYHLPRAFLTFVATLGQMEGGAPALPDRLRILPFAVSHTRWSECPPGGDRTREALFHVEHVKRQEYEALRHCATVADGMAYLKRWETR